MVCNFNLTTEMNQQQQLVIKLDNGLFVMGS